jgi:hypothetical protein
VQWGVKAHLAEAAAVVESIADDTTPRETLMKEMTLTHKQTIENSMCLAEPKKRSIFVVGNTVKSSDADGVGVKVHLAGRLV